MKIGKILKKNCIESQLLHGKEKCYKSTENKMENPPIPQQNRKKLFFMFCSFDFWFSNTNIPEHNEVCTAVCGDVFYNL